jgi:peptidoglycan hydrolase-like protein with peptidoglycan-binding domain
VDGFFGTETREAVRDFQYWHDLKVTGYPDLNMLTLLETLAEVPAKKASQPDAKRKE